MVSLIRILLILFLVPAILAAPQCPVSVSSRLTTSGRYNTYTATVTNTGNAAVSSVQLTFPRTLHDVNNAANKRDGKVLLPSSIPVGGSATFSFEVTNTYKGAVTWTSTCTVSSATAAPGSTTTKAPTTTTTTKPTTAPTTTKKGTTTTVKATTKPIKSTLAPVTTKPVTLPPAATGGKLCPAGSWWAPAPMTTWQWQLTGTLDLTKNVQMYDIDLFDAKQSDIDAIHALGKAVICYFSTQYEDWRPDASDFPASTLGKNLDDWEGEKYVDIRSTVVRNAMKARLDIAVSKKCDGVEPDNVDGFQTSTGFPVTAADQINFNTFLANEAHARGLSVGLKNDGDQAKTLQPSFDWALNEQCNEYSECDALDVFINAGKAVFNCEYSGKGATICPAMQSAKFSTLIKNLDLNAAITAQCCTYGSCNAVPYECVTSSSSKRSARSLDENLTVPEFAIDEVPTASAPALFASAAVAATAALVAILL